MPTFVDELREPVEAFLAPVVASDAPPPNVVALVVLYQIVGGLFDQLSSVSIVWDVKVSVDDDLCPGEEVILIPLVTAARLPRETTAVAKLGAAHTGYVVASEKELDDSRAGRATLPLLLGCNFQELLDGGIFWTVSWVRFLLANCARLLPAPPACADVVLNALNGNKGRARRYMAVGPVGSIQFNFPLLELGDETRRQKDSVRIHGD